MEQLNFDIHNYIRNIINSICRKHRISRSDIWVDVYVTRSQFIAMHSKCQTHIPNNDRTIASIKGSSVSLSKPESGEDPISLLSHKETYKAIEARMLEIMVTSTVVK